MIELAGPEIVATFLADPRTNEISETTSVIARAPTADLSWRTPRSVLLVLSLAAMLEAALGCVHVRPYQRERLTHPTMTTADVGGPGEAHARAVREGATGGGTAGEAGCGCN